MGSKKNKEIEIKFSIEENLYQNIEKTLIKIAEFQREFRQIDRYFNAPHRDFLEPEHPCEYLRLRETEGRGVITYKNVHLGESGEFLYADEYETEVKDIEQIFNILKVLNFEEFITIDKKRKEYVYEDKLEIVLDRVKDLGSFIELETKSDFNDLESARNYIFSVAEKLGIDFKQQHNDGYVLAMMKKRGLK